MITLPDNSRPPQTFSTWVDPNKLYCWLNAPYQTILETTFPIALANIIAEYADYNLGRNATNWYTALCKLNLLPALIPPLPPNIHEIMTANSPIRENAKVHETHSLYLMPGGAIDDLAERFYKKPHAPYLSEILNHSFLWPSSLRRTDSVIFPKHEWVLISELLSGSLNQSHNAQMKLIRTLNKTSFLQYEALTFKYAMGAHLLNITAEDRGLWVNGLEEGRCSSLKEWYRQREWTNGLNGPDTKMLFVGSNLCELYSPDIPTFGECDYYTGEKNIGIAAIYRFPEDAEPPKNRCLPSKQLKCSIS